MSFITRAFFAPFLLLALLSEDESLGQCNRKAALGVRQQHERPQIKFSLSETCIFSILLCYSQKESLSIYLMPVYILVSASDFVFSQEKRMSFHYNDNAND